MATADERLAALEKTVAEHAGVIAQLRAALSGTPLAAATQTPSGDMLPLDLDGRGNFVVRKKPPRYEGEDESGRTLSACSPAFLDALGGFMQWAASKDAAAGETKKAAYNRTDSARCYAWAARLRSGWTAPKADNGYPATFDDVASDADDLAF